MKSLKKILKSKQNISQRFSMALVSPLNDKLNLACRDGQAIALKQRQLKELRYLFLTASNETKFI